MLINKENMKHSGMMVGLANAVMTTNAFATASIATQAPFIGGFILGKLLFHIPTQCLHSRIDAHFEAGGNTNICYHFMLQVASSTLSTLLCLMIMSTFMTIAANPFTLPALIAVGISAAIMLGVYVATSPRTQTIDAESARDNEIKELLRI